MGLLQRLLGSKLTGTIVASRSGISLDPSIAIEGDWLVIRMHAPEIDASTVTFDSHEGHVHLHASGTNADGNKVKIDEMVRVTGGDESRAQVTKEGDDLVIRMPRG